MGIPRPKSDEMNPIRNNQTKPNQTQTTPSRAGGISRSRISVAPGASVDGELPAWSERRADLFEFVQTHLSDEHEGFCVVAAIAVRQSGRKITRNAILDRLRATGRTAEQLREKGWL